MKHLFVINDTCNNEAKTYYIDAETKEDAKKNFVFKAFPVAPDNFTYSMLQEMTLREELDIIYAGEENAIKSL